MKPAISIVVFTVLSGGGLGLAAVTAVAGAATRSEFIWAAAVAVVMTGAGLLASVFHLANPKNAWRAFSRARTSWLSREAICATLFFALFVPWAALHALGHPIWVLRVLVFAVSLLAVFCTAMIYQSLKTVAAWHHPLTACGYLLFALQSGAMLFIVCASFGGGVDVIPLAAVVPLTLLAVAAKSLQYRRIGRAEDIRVGRAVGFSRAQAKLLETGHAGQTFLGKEFLFLVPAHRLRSLRLFSLSAILLAPLAGSAFAFFDQPVLAVIAACVLFAGLLAERWLFFAEAKHSVRTYYGMGPF